jgi:iron complex outermembrane receptor protein
LTVGVLQQRQTDNGQAQADNNAAVGTGNIYTLPSLPADATFADPYTNRNDRSTEWFAYDRVAWTSTISTWAGLRHSRLDRQSVRTDGSRATSYQQSFTTPWLAIAWQATPQTLAYASAGQGVESFVAPGRSRYTNAGQPLSPLKSRQWELGVKHYTATGHLGAALFQITRPRAGDAGACDVAGSCTFQMDGDDQHQGLELTTQQRLGAWSLDASSTVLHAQRRASTIDPSLNGQRPTNVPKMVLRAGATYAVASVPGLSVQARLSHEGGRTVVPNGTITLPAWTTLDASVAYRTNLSGKPATWRLGVNNLADKRYFKESPYQYSHVYLFPGAPRTWRVSLDAGF